MHCQHLFFQSVLTKPQTNFGRGLHSPMPSRNQAPPKRHGTSCLSSQETNQMIIQATQSSNWRHSVEQGESRFATPRMPPPCGATTLTGVVGPRHTDHLLIVKTVPNWSAHLTFLSHAADRGEHQRPILNRSSFCQNFISLK